MRTNVYFDGFNFYYGLVKDRPGLKWLDLASLSRALLLRHQELGRIRYFTAPAKSFAPNPEQANRQQTYFEALETLPELSIHKGKFHQQRKRRPTDLSLKKFVWIHDMEEKGSDVNLATHLLLDAMKEDMEAALVVTDDTDQIEPLRRVQSDLGITLGVASPRQRKHLSQIVRAAYYRPIWPEWLAQHLFPDEIELEDGAIISRPSEWR
jgi:uncharacterized LabA/DUF88 family protein